MDTIKIDIKYTKENIYASYFNKSFYNTLDIKYFQKSLILASVLIVLYLYTLTICEHSNEYFFAFGLLLLPSLLTLRNFASYIFRSIKWKTQIDEYVNKTLAYKKTIFTINDKGCGMEIDSENQFKYWDYITKYTANEKFIRIYDKDEDFILIPKNSIDHKTFSDISAILEKKGDILNKNKQADT